MPSEVSITFSGQIEEFCSEIRAEAFIVSNRPETGVLEDDPFKLEHLPKRERRGLFYFVEEMRYCFCLARRARRFKADVALLDSGTTQFFMMALFPLLGIPVIPILHNSLWPKGFRPESRGQRIIQWLDGMFWRRVPRAVLAVSPEVQRQVEELAGPHHRPIHQIRAQFDPQYFSSIPPADPDAVPFRVMFIGRVVPEKGVLDIPVMARAIEDRAPGFVRWTICGRGTALEMLRARIVELGLSQVVEVHGWTSLEDLQRIYAESHVSIVPTRSGFTEGLAMTAAEAILAGRPLVTNPIVPALELLAPAAMEARSNDAESHAEAVFALASDRQLYRQLQAACASLSGQFYDRSQGIAAVLKRVLATKKVNLRDDISDSRK